MHEIKRNLLCLMVLAVVISSVCSLNVKFGYKKDAIIDCSNLGSDVSFYQKLNGSDEEVKLETGKDDRVVIKDSVLYLKDLRNPEITANYACKSSSGKKEDIVKQILPFLIKPEKQSQTITQNGFVELVCKLLYGDTDGLKWEWKKGNETFVGDNTDRVKIQTSQLETNITIKNINEADRGEYTCILSNDYGENSETIMVRVKDPLAALWPFLAIIAEVVVLCIVILIYEKKCTKKPNADDDNEQAHNLLQEGDKKKTVRA